MSVLLIGCGRMGGALARGWTDSHHVLAYDPQASELPDGVERVETLDGVDAAVVVLAVKPQVFPSIAQDLAALASRNPLFVSIMAGVTLDGLSSALGGSRRIVRAMPNTPAAIGHGITAAVADNGVGADDRTLVTTLLEASGQFVWLDREGDLDAVTAVSGSGPAYFFRFTEALAQAGVAAGLTPDLAMQLARATFSGAAALADHQPEPLSDLRKQVTSPGGTTAAGLAVMDDGGAIDDLVERVVTAAAIRSRELAG